MHTYLGMPGSSESGQTDDTVADQDGETGSTTVVIAIIVIVFQSQKIAKLAEHLTVFFVTFQIPAVNATPSLTVGAHLK